MMPRLTDRRSPAAAVTCPRAAASALLVLGMLAMAWAPASRAAEPRSGTTSRAAREDAVRAIPFDRFDADARAKAASVIHASSLFRRLPTETIECDPNLYVFLVRHPEVVVDMWEMMGFTDLKLKRTGPESFLASDEDGTSGRVEFLFGDRQIHILYVEGQYRGSLYPRPIAANAVLVLQTRYMRTRDGRYFVTSQLDVFVDVKNLGIDLLARTLQNAFGRTSDHNFNQTAGFVSRLSRTAERNAPGVERMAAQLVRLDPEVRAQFVEVVGGVGRRAMAAREVNSEMTASGTQETPPRR